MGITFQQIISSLSPNGVREWGGFLEVHPQTSTEQSLLGDLPTPKNSQASLWIILGDTKQSQNDPAQELLPKADSHSLVRWGSHQKSPPISVYGHLKTKFPLGDFPISLTYTIRNSSLLPPTHLQDTVGGAHVKGNFISTEAKIVFYIRTIWESGKNFLSGVTWY